MYYNRNIKIGELSPALYNWLKEYAPMWELKEVSNPAEDKSRRSVYWGIVNINKMNR